jgi:hypothetical protein
MNVLSREAILGAQDLKPTPVDVPEWDGTVYVRQLTGAERGALEAEAMADRTNHVATLRQRMAVRCLCDADGKRLFTDADAPALAAKSAAALDRIFAAIAKASALGDEGVATAGESSTGVPSTGSGSGSP